MESAIILLIIVAILFIYRIWSLKNKRQREKQISKMIDSISSYSPTRVFSHDWKKTYLGIDDKAKKVLLANVCTDKYACELITDFSVDRYLMEATNSIFQKNLGLLIDDSNKKALLFSMDTTADTMKYNVIEDIGCSFSHLQVKPVIDCKSAFYIIDDVNRKILLGTLVDYTYKVISYEDIISVELIEDGNTIQSKSTIRAIGGGLIGAAISGGAGAIIGGLSGNSTEKREVKNIELKILIRNMQESSYSVVFYNSTAISTSSKHYKGVYETVSKIKDVISVIIDNVDKKETGRQQGENVASKLEMGNKDITEELIKLSSLKEKGMLTEEEFSKLKQKLISE